MALNETRRIIWLDAYIGQDNECHSFKRMFSTTLDPLARIADPLDIIVCALNENAAPFIFVDTREKAMEQIEIHHDKQIIFISSGSLGERIIPIISSRYHNIYSYYIFCAIIENYVDFAYGYLNYLQMFNNELDLLVRLVRDISEEIINQGRVELTLNRPEHALTCFQHSSVLEKTANEKDTLNGSFFDHLRLLNGYGGKTGLIQEAQNQIDERERQRSEDGLQEPIITERDALAEQEELINEHPDSPVGQQDGE